MNTSKISSAGALQKAEYLTDVQIPAQSSHEKTDIILMTGLTLRAVQKIFYL